MYLNAMFRIRPFVVVIGTLIFAVAGAAAFRTLPVDLLPGLDYPLVNVITQYPAGTAEDAEILLTRPIESAMNGLANVKRIRSVSAPGLSQVTVEFTWGTAVTTARQQVAGALASVGSALPAEAVPQVENIGSSLAAISTYTVHGSADQVALRGWADYAVRPALESLPGVLRVKVLGAGREAMRVDLDPRRMRRAGVNVADAVKAIGNANVLSTAGVISDHGRDRIVATRGQIRDIAALRGVLVKMSGDGSPVLLSHIADIREGSVPARYAITDDRRPAVALLVEKQPGASTLAVSTAVDRALAGLTPPAGIQIRKFYDQAEIIGSAYRNMRNQLIAGAVIALGILFFVLGRSRVTFVLAATIPLSVVGVFILMRWLGLGVNLMTISALTVAIGMIVDDGIIVLENIFRHHAEGKARADAAREGTREIFGADVSGTLVVLAAFVPLVFLSGLAGRLFYPFGITFGGVLALSLILSLTLIPWAAARWLSNDSGAHARATRTVDDALAWIVRHNDAVLRFLLQHRASAIIASLFLVIGAGVLLMFNPVRFLPLLDEGSLLVSYQLAPGTSLRESNRVATALEATVLRQPGVTAVYRRTGSPGQSGFIEGPEAGELILRLKGDGKYSADDIRRSLDATLGNLPGILTRINEPTSEKIDESLSGLPNVFGIALFGSRLGMLRDAADKVEAAVRRVPGISNVANSNRIPVDTLDVEIDRAACARLGVTPKSVAQVLQVAIQGQTVAANIVNGHLNHIYVRFADAALLQPADLSEILVPTEAGAQVPLSLVAQVVPQSQFATIEHQFGSRAMVLTVDISANPVSVIHDLRRTIDGIALPPGVRVAFVGEYQEMIRTAVELALIVLASALLVFGIMAVQFGNLVDPAVILFKLPIDFMGAAVALFITRQELDLTVMIDVVTLVGVSMNNGIVLLSFAKLLRETVLGAAEAIRKAVAVRIRPMLLTQLTSVIGLMPAALGMGSGPQLLQPLAVMLFGGLLAGAFLTLNLIPVLYVSTDRFRAPNSGVDV